MLNHIFLGNPLRDWLLAACVFIVTFLVTPALKSRIRAQRRRWQAMQSPTPTLELLALLLARTSQLVVLVFALYFAEKILNWPKRVDRIFDVIIVFGIWLQVGLWATTALRFFLERRQQRAGLHDAAAASTVNVLMFIGQLLIWAVFVLLALDNLGVNITALVAGLGVGGIAIALAVQTILGDVFGSLSIAFDKPFVVGDTLRIDDIEGTVEHIGIKSTRLRSITGEQVILANADVLKARVRNLGRMPERRVLLKLGVEYGTPAEKLDQVTDIVKRVVESVPDTRFVQCVLANLGDYALQFEAIYFVANRPGMRHADSVDMVNRGALRALAAAGIGLAFPTQRVLVEREHQG
ncbi:MAG TPA: mechanosensitive ion channel family protein [Steroidobacteraceae bacterium]|nr:mechanosensitive ion channel family protein [Steroidobacteraceae bacterium]